MDPDCDDGLPKFLHPERRRSFHTKYLTEVEGSDDLIVMKQVLGECGIRNASVRECEIVKKICKVGGQKVVKERFNSHRWVNL